ncbi:MAG: hypothetical protein ACP5OG_01755 [Candidatus Nanoarchaeia archaeon]
MKTTDFYYINNSKLDFDFDNPKEKDEGKSLEVFSRSPPYGHRIDDLKSFAVLGIDIKITPDGQVKVIEVNGINTGMKGFREAGVQHNSNRYPTVDELRSQFKFDLENSELWGYVKQSLDSHNSCDEALRRHIRGLGREPIAYIGARLGQEGQSFSRMEGADALLRRELEQEANSDYLGKLIFRMNDFLSTDRLRDVHYEWDQKYGHFVRTLKGIEEVLEDKFDSDALFENCRDFKPQTYEYTEENFQRLIRDYNPRFVVIKPRDGARGEGLEVVEANATPENRPRPSSNLVAEPFAPSKPIFSEKDGQYHDGCMRYVVFAEEDKDGQIKLYHFGGYWRLCPNPISDNLDLNGMRANLAQGALAQKVSSEDLDLVERAINKHMPNFYRSLVERTDPNRLFRAFEEKYGYMMK